MTFPVTLDVLGARLPAHPIFELTGYALGFAIYLRGRWSRAALPSEETAWVLLCAFSGALVGAVALAWPGRTIVGGLLGGWAGVEAAKWKLGITARTGDAYVFPILAGLAVGRIGCFLTGLSDGTCGVPTALPWGVDFGDGVPRHPTQLYEIGFLLLLAIPLSLAVRRSRPQGALFRVFLLGYLGFRFAVEFVKPPGKQFVGVSPIQLASLAGIAVCAWQLWSIHRSWKLEGGLDGAAAYR